MEITKKIFWSEAMKGGSIIGLVTAAFQLTRTVIEQAAWLNIVSLVVFVFLIYGFTRKIAGMADHGVRFCHDAIYRYHNGIRHISDQQFHHQGYRYRNGGPANECNARTAHHRAVQLYV